MDETKELRTKKQEFAIEVAREAIKLYKAEEEKKKKNKALYNVNLLLEHYLELQTFCESAVSKEDPFALDELTGKIYKILDEVEGAEVEVKSIEKSKQRTLMMIDRIDIALVLLKQKCQDDKSPTAMDKYTVIDMLHLDPNLQQLEWSDRLGTVALELDKSEATIRRWRADMVKQLGIFIFGVDGLKLIE